MDILAEEAVKGLGVYAEQDADVVCIDGNEHG